ncbi:E3 ubiquitin-protein ligase TRIM33 isoform X1 [Scophthalmus maximus]|uniref:E3 ubiquitin-protein ligase TRIM33 isoform X1 n=1 Tax=Scophthalmus maximus TaxID=52904 RepID=UPI0015E075E2|nr:E3 ubiquitin-protein ligase TRIM33 isoform X1 [Scophthalmus maximus]
MQRSGPVNAAAAMNPGGETHLNSRPGDVTASHPQSTPGDGDASHNASPPLEASSEQDGGHNLDRGVSPLPESDPVFILRSVLGARLETPPSVFIPVPNPYPGAAPASLQVSIIIPSPDLFPSSLSPPPQCPEDASPDLECAVCFSEFNNVFRCPKMLHCRHTFCLECLARINVKSAEPGAIQCPLCRGLTPLPALGLPRLPTDPDVLSYLPAAMQRVYSIRYLRNKGKLEVKRSSEGHGRWGQRAQRSRDRSLDVGIPSPPVGGRGQVGGVGGVGGALFRLTGRPACRAFLLTSVVMMVALLTGIVIFLLTYKKESA